MDSRTGSLRYTVSAVPGMRPRARLAARPPLADGTRSRQAAEGRGSQLRPLTRRNEHVMMTADRLARIKGTDGKISLEQFRTWVVAQSVRNALETFHGVWAFDPDHPESGEGFISDHQMRALNITIRRAVHEALAHVDIARNVATQPHGRELHARQTEALDFCEFQLATVHDYMEPPGSPELEEAYQRYVSEPDVNR